MIRSDCIVLLFAFVLAFPSLLTAQPADIVGYEIAWFDEFDGSSLDSSKWYASNTNQTTNNSLQDYLPSQVSVSNGKLIIKSENIPSRGLPYRSGAVNSISEQRYGRWEVKAKLPSTRGMWPAIWLLPNTQVHWWPREGEIDIMENRGDEPFKTSSAFHWGTNPPYSHSFVYREQSTYHNGLANFHDSFHTYACEWDENQVRFFVDGVHYYTVYNDRTNGFLANQSAHMRLIINTAIGGNFLENPDGSTVWPQQMEVDYVHVWTKSESGRGMRLLNGGFEEQNGSLAGWRTFGSSIANVQANREYVQSGSNSLKLYGEFDGQISHSGVEQGVQVSPGMRVTATASAFVPGNDSIAGTGNQALLKIDFYSQFHGEYGSSSYLGSISKTIADSSSPNDVWLSETVSGFAPASAKEARLAIVFEQPNNESGAVHFDNAFLQYSRWARSRIRDRSE